jgi:hypothetical protein
VKKWPEAARQVNNNGDTPLHYLFKRHADNQAPVEIVELVLDLFPGALAMQGDSNYTPLHCACRDGAPVQAVELLLNRGPSALQMLDFERNSPLHLACDSEEFNVSENVIRLLIERDPSMLQLVNERGDTPFRNACECSVPVETLRIMFNLWPIPCLLMGTFYDEDEDEGNEIHLLPHGVCMSKNREANVVDLVGNATNDAVCTLLECVTTPRGIMPASVISHLRETLAASVPNFQMPTSGAVLTEYLRPHLTPDLVTRLVDNDELQTLLKEDQDLQSLICGLVRMHKSGRNYFLEDPGDRPKGVCVMESASGNVDCLFLHVRENSLALCDRQQFFRTTSSNTMVTSSTTMVAQPNCRNEMERLYGTNEICTNCNVLEKYSQAKKLFRCGSCHQVLYCSRECQRAHWKKTHKKECVGTKKKK